MKKLLIIGILGLFASVCCFTQAQEADDIIGYYLASDPKTNENVQMEIYKTSEGKYEGKVVWVENKEFQDEVGTVQIKNLVYSEKNKDWRKGKVVYEGGQYSLTVNINKPGELKLRGFLGVSLLGKTMYWQKEDKLRK